jgi:hypothetical protein
VAAGVAVAVRRLIMRAPTSITVREAAGEWLAAADAGVVRTRSGSPYKPSALRSYEEALRTKLLPELGHLRLSAVSRNCLQDLQIAARRCSRRRRAPGPLRPAARLQPPDGRDPTPLNTAARLHRRDLLGGLIHEYEAA